MEAVHDLCRRIQIIRQQTPAKRATLIGISGIDASGKGYFSKLIADELARHSLRVALVNVDHWVTLPSQRFSQTEPASHFYEHGLRLDEMWEEVVLPLHKTRSIHRSIDACDATNAERYISLRFDHEGIDVLLLEGIFLFKKQYQDRFEFKVWIDCSFKTAMRRAIRRNQEQMAESDIERDYEAIYFPAQRLHFEKDNPQACADLTIRNDDQIG
ncbi:MAG TPA: hypothetical protein PLN21_00535 [Gemmatales bacterium]|nr:hypothetical protein [Gemmatales bacterium]